jgi:hypothetical protein
MSDWRNSFVGTDPSFELLFERFELMGSLVAFEDNEEAQLEELHGATTRKVVLATMPIGRIGWHETQARVLLQELEDETLISDLLKQGYAKGSRRFFELFIVNFNLYAQHMLW